MYTSHFEPALLYSTRNYYREEASRLLEQLTTTEFLIHVNTRIDQECTDRLKSYLDEMSKIPLMDIMTAEMIHENIDRLLDKGMCIGNSVMISINKIVCRLWCNDGSFRKEIAPHILYCSFRQASTQWRLWEITICIWKLHQGKTIKEMGGFIILTIDIISDGAQSWSKTKAKIKIWSRWFSHSNAISTPFVQSALSMMPCFYIQSRKALKHSSTVDAVALPSF